MTATIRKAVVLCSGGVDSTTAMAMAFSQGFAIYSLSFRYGQRHVCELQAAARVSNYFNASQHLILDLPLDAIGASALTTSVDIPKDRSFEEIGKEIPRTYVPARNTIFLSFALAWAEVIGAQDIFIGANAIDYSGYPDCRPEYLEAFEQMANRALKATVEGSMRIRIRAPLLHMTKAEIVKTGIRYGVDFSMTHSCYDPLPNGTPCQRCDSCILREKGFREAGIPDPLLRRSHV
ncbi:MAG: 7-cyano-7-deazaguanine synthase QueC [Desulfobacterota bacterium]|nr:7-cyano-7-deazaguanine synthase QueC [Thermodesulfobacteriota bacterium]